MSTARALWATLDENTKDSLSGFLTDDELLHVEEGSRLRDPEALAARLQEALDRQHTAETRRAPVRPRRLPESGRAHPPPSPATAFHVAPDGRATAALVLAILSFLVLPLVGAVIALLLVGGRRTSESSHGHAARILAWVNVGLCAVVAVAVGAIVAVSALGERADENFAEISRAIDPAGLPDRPCREFPLTSSEFNDLLEATDSLDVLSAVAAIVNSGSGNDPWEVLVAQADQGDIDRLCRVLATT